MTSSKRTSPKRTKRKRTSAASEPRNPSRSAAPPRSNWMFYALIALIVIPGLGFWAYLKWVTPAAPDNTQAAENSEQTQETDSVPGWLVNASGEGWNSESERGKSWEQVDDPSSDGWDTEVFANQVSEQWYRVKKLWTDSKTIDSELLSGLAAADVSVSPLRPQRLDTMFQDSVLHVQRGMIDEHAPEVERGVAPLAGALEQIAAAYRDRTNLRIKFKVFRVEQVADGIATKQLVELFGESSEGLLEENAIWTVVWRQSEDDLPLMTRLAVDQYERVDRFGDTLFSDCTQSVLNANRSFHEQLLQGYNHWLGRSQFRRFFSILGNPGLAMGDVDGDGLEDIYVCQEDGLPNLLYVQNPDGTLRDASRESSADWIQNSRTALLVDLNNDGHQDLAVAMTGGLVIAEGSGDGRFEIRQILDTSDDLMVLTASDFDQDGRLDLYAGAYYRDGVLGNTEETAIGGAGGQFIFYNANDGGPNSLFRNEINQGEWAFRDVTVDTGLNSNNRRYSLAAAWEDFDNDGDQDLYVANDYGLNNLYRNDRRDDGTREFVDIAHEAGAEDCASGMSVTWGDYDRDGWMDLYVSNMYSTAGNRVTFQNQFKTDASDDIKKRFQRFAKGNTLLRNLGGSGETTDDTSHRFQDLSIEAGVNRGRWAWGSYFVDVNNDGWDDLVVANGYITTDDSGDL